MEYPRLDLDGANLAKGAQDLLDKLRVEYSTSGKTREDGAYKAGLFDAFVIMTRLDEPAATALLFPIPGGGAR